MSKAIMPSAWTLVAGLCVATAGCGAAHAPGHGGQLAAGHEFKPTPAQSASTSGAGHDMDVDVQVDANDNGEPAPPRAEPPPTRTYSPANKLGPESKP
jgi:hypothetical protein